MLLSGFKIIAITCYCQCLMEIEEAVSLIFQGTGEGVVWAISTEIKEDLELPGKKDMFTLRINESLWYNQLVPRGHPCPSCPPSPSFLLFRDLLLLVFLLLFLSFSFFWVTQVMLYFQLNITLTFSSRKFNSSPCPAYLHWLPVYLWKLSYSMWTSHAFPSNQPSSRRQHDWISTTFSLGSEYFLGFLGS